ncbi:hypothetical protein [Pseudomonas sp. EA_105y_Pfl2_R69]|uniref:hypothetical protein n=1 Tax=Pseudomonas sp. EA_105y_Pfl2_R69 TaxID=3088683 RepID=UPI0030D98A18
MEDVNNVVGLHVISDFGSDYTYVSEAPDHIEISNTIKRLDWQKGFHQVILVTAPGVSMEVGGSLDPSDGLSSVYRDINKSIYRVTVDPPISVNQMEKILLSFHAGDNQWEKMYKYE